MKTLEAKKGRSVCQIVICERDGDWASLLRRETWGVRETRSLDECWHEVAQAGKPRIVLLDVRCGPLEALLRGVDWMRRRYPDLLPIAIAPESTRLAIWRPLCETGVLHFVSSFRDLPALRRVVCRHRQRYPKPPLSLEERIWNNLPWPSKSAPTP